MFKRNESDTLRSLSLSIFTSWIRSFQLADSCSLSSKQRGMASGTVMTYYGYLFEPRRADLEWKREPNDKSRNQSIRYEAAIWLHEYIFLLCNKIGHSRAAYRYR